MRLTLLVLAAIVAAVIAPVASASPAAPLGCSPALEALAPSPPGERLRDELAAREASGWTVTPEGRAFAAGLPAGSPVAAPAGQRPAGRGGLTMVAHGGPPAPDGAAFSSWGYLFCGFGISAEALFITLPGFSRAYARLHYIGGSAYNYTAHLGSQRCWAWLVTCMYIAWDNPSDWYSVTWLKVASTGPVWLEWGLCLY